MAEKNFLSGLMLLGLAGAVLLIVNEGLGHTVSLFFVVAMAGIAVLSLLFLALGSHSYMMFLTFFMAGLVFSTFRFANGDKTLLLFVVVLANLVGFALVLSTPSGPIKKQKKSTSKKKAVAKQLGKKEANAKVKVIKKRKTAKKRRKRKKK